MALEHPAVHLDDVPRRGELGVVPLRVGHALRREGAEEVVDELVVRPVALGLEAARQEQRVDPVGVAAADAPLEQGAGDPEAVGALLALPAGDAPVEEVDHDRHDVVVAGRVGLVGARTVGIGVVEYGDEHASVHARARVHPGGDERGPPLDELGDHVDLVARPARLLGREHRPDARLVLPEVLRLVGERPQRDRVGRGVRHGARPAGEGHDRTGHGQPAVRDARGLGLGEHRRLVGEDVRVVGAEVVEVEELLVEEARRAGEREEGGGADLAHEARRACELVLTFAAPERPALLLRHPVHHRVPDRAGELHQVAVVGAELEDRVEVGGLGVVLVEEPGDAVVERERGVADRTVGRRDQRVGQDAQAVDLDRLAVVRLQEPVEPDRLQGPAVVRGREVGEDHDRVLVDVVAEERGVEVVVVRVRHVQEVGGGDPLEQAAGEEPAVVGEREPRREERGVEPRVAEHGPVRGVDEGPGVTEERDLHRDQARAWGPTGRGGGGG